MKTTETIKIFLLCILFCFVISCSASNSKKFASTLGSKNFDESYGLAVDKDSNIIITGIFSDTLFYNENTYLVSWGESNVFLAKYSKTGDLLWLKSIEELGVDESYSVTLNDQNEIYICGHSGMQPFVAKFSEDGEQEWMSKIDGKGECIDLIWKNNELYVLGAFYDTLNHDVVSKGSSDIFLVKLNEKGNIVKTRTFGFQGEDFGKKIILSNDSTLIFCGSVTQETNVDRDIAVFEVNTDLALKKSSFFGSYGDDGALFVFQKSSGDIMLCGQFSGAEIKHSSGSINVNYLGKSDAFVCGLNEDLSPKNFYTAGSAENDWMMDLAFDANNNLWCNMVLNANATLNFNEKKNLTGFGNYDIALAGLDSNNRLTTAVSFGNEKENGANRIFISPDDEIYLTGWFEGEMSFGKGLTIKSRNGGDAFLIKTDLKSINIR